MAFRFRRRIQAKGPDRFIINLDEQERLVLRALPEDMLTALADHDANPLLRRLFPVAHATDDAVNAAYRDLVHSDLLRTRAEILKRVVDTAEARELDRQTLDQWMVGLNTIRLVIGTRLDVTEDASPELQPDDPDLQAWVLYEFLGSLLDAIVKALTDTM